MAFTLSETAERRVKELQKLYPDPKSAVMPALYLAQEELGSVTAEAIDWVADRIGMPPVHVMEVATFYTMYYKKPVGKYHVQVCRTCSCAVLGAKKLTECLQKQLGVAPGEVTPDGMWSYEEVECLGSCGTAPMCEINDTFFENLNPEKLQQVLARIAKERPDLRLSTAKDELGAGLAGVSKSEVACG
jgi:NADH-quinone oxidoreductase subunit E